MGVFNYEAVKSGYSIFPERFAGLFNITDPGSGFAQQERLTSVLHIVLAFLGCVGNALICYVILINKRMRTVINCYFISQAVSDLIFLLSFMLATIYCMNISSIIPGEFAVSTLFHKLLHYISYHSSSIVKMNIALDRYIAICHPLKSVDLQAGHRTLKIIAGIWTYSLLISIFNVVCLDFPDSNCRWFEVYANIDSTLIVAFPITVIVVLYSLIGLKIWKSSKLSKHSGDHQKDLKMRSSRRRKGLDITVAVMFEYIICWTPLAIILVSYMYNLIDKSQVRRNLLFLFVASIMYLLSAMVNPILYSLLSNKYRKAFKDLLCCSGYQKCNQEEI